MQSLISRFLAVLIARYWGAPLAMICWIQSDLS
jgi:hypothetical protein